ncbi:hypothetical protein ACSBR2_028283 [Camellia fascicularis]
MANKNNDQDMFSYLTDSLILIIISFLPFKEAARTSTLSKRWQFLWHETKNIELDETLFVKPQNHQSNEETIGNQRRGFIDFSTQFIQGFRPVSVDKFRLSFSHPENYVEAMQNFVQFAIGHNAKVLELDFSEPTWDQQDFDLDLDNNHADLFELPPCVYEHKEPFKSLKLFACKFRVSQFINFSALTSLSLAWIQLSTTSFNALLSNCRLLESLSLKKCWNLENLNISAARLRTLVIDKCWSLENGIGIETPKLLFFKYSGPMNGFMIDYLNALEEADLDFGFEAEFGEYGDILYDLLRDIGCIRVLTVCSYMLQIISTAEEYPMLKPPLYKMRHLIMKTALHINEYHGISFFLFSCPRLQTLTIHISSSTTIFPEREATLSLAEHEFLSNGYIMVYKCLKRTLKVVNVTGFKGHLNEMLAIQYFIKYGYALETLYINLSNEKGPDGIDMEASYRANAEFLSQIHRASNALNIFIN